MALTKKEEAAKYLKEFAILKETVEFLIAEVNKKLSVLDVLEDDCEVSDKAEAKINAEILSLISRLKWESKNSIELEKKWKAAVSKIK